MITEKNPFNKLYLDILKGQTSLSDTKKRINEKNINDFKVSIDPIDIENKWHEQDGKCHWTGMEMDLGLLLNSQDSNCSMHPLAPCVDRINLEKNYEYENIVISIKMISLGRDSYSFDKFYDIMTKITESLISNKTSPAYIKKYFIEKQQKENMEKQITSSQKPKITWDDIFFINPQLKSTLSNV